MKFSYPKSEKLKQKKTIDLLFSEGRSVSKYPLRLVYVLLENDSNSELKFGASVSKKYFKKAVDRNYYKRVLRESFRLNKHLILDNLDNTYAIMLFYQSSDRLPYQEIHLKTIQLLEKFRKQIEYDKNE
jgi:ribonuclease P protein component